MIYNILIVKQNLKKLHPIGVKFSCKVFSHSHEDIHDNLFKYKSTYYIEKREK